MKRSSFLALACSTGLLLGGMAFAAPAQAADPIGMNAVYEYFGWGSPQNPTTVMSATGIKQFTLAFMLSDGGCNPKWDGSMNGKTDEPGETVTTADFNTMLSYAKSHHIARFTFWSVNRDRQCTSGSDADACSGISQSPYAFTKIIAQYHG